MDFLKSLKFNSIDYIAPYDFHLHTAWTDGANSTREMYDQAILCGLEAILFSEHVRKTSAEWFGAFVDEIHSLPRSSCQALVGMETKVEDYEGNIDCTSTMIAKSDLVIASVHRFPGKKGDSPIEFDQITSEAAVEVEYRLAMAVLDNPAVHILGHPFGMCYSRYKINPPENKIRALIKKAAEKEIAFEVNCRYHQNPWSLVKWCQEEGVNISLGSDAHKIQEVGRIIRVLKGEEPA